MEPEKTVLIDNKPVLVSETRTTFLEKGSLQSPSPMWARYMFRITFLVTTAAVGYIAATNIIPQGTKYEVTLILKLLVDPIVFGISKMFGITLKDEG